MPVGGLLVLPADVEYGGLIVQAALERNSWNQSRAARSLGITRNTLIYRMQKFDLAPPD